jgi:hypothetical protein
MYNPIDQDSFLYKFVCICTCRDEALAKADRGRRDMRQMKLMLALGLIATCVGLRATDNAHYYKSANLHRNPSTAWFDDLHYYEIEDWLQKIDSNIMYGDAGSCWDKNGHSTALLNSTGAYDLKWAAQNVQLTDNNNIYQNMINNFTQVNANGAPAEFGTLEFDGKFELWESNYQVRKNLKWGLFLEARVPMRSLKIKNISYVDKGPDRDPSEQFVGQWAQIKNNLDNILNEFGIKPYATEYSKAGLGDVSFLIGWEDVFEKRDDKGEDLLTLWLTARAGVLCPTGERVKTDYLFAMPTGYNDHWGITGSLELDMGVLPWLSIDLYGGFTWFFDDNHREMRMKTFSAQNGYILLAKGIAKEDLGTLWYLGGDVKFDHVWEGLSAIVGYSYNRQEDTDLTPQNTNLFDSAAANSDSRLDGWYTHVLHFMLDYDISLHMSKCTKWAPRVNVFFNLPVDGKNAFKTENYGAGLGIDMKW